MAEESYWLWNGGEVEGPVALSTLIEKLAAGQLGPDARVMPTDSQEWVAVDRIGLGDEPIAQASPASKEIQTRSLTEVSLKKPPTIIQAVSQAFAALVVGVGVVFAGIAKLALSVKGLAVGTAVVSARDGHALEGLGVDDAKGARREGSYPLHPPHLGMIQWAYHWYLSHAVLVHELFAIVLGLGIIVFLERRLRRPPLIIKNGHFRTAVALSFLFLAAQISSLFLQPLPGPLVAFINASENSMSVSSTIIESSTLIVLLVSYGGLFFLKSWARVLFACVVGISMINDIFSGPLVETASAQIFGSLSDLFSGAILAIAYLTPLFSSTIIQANPTTPLEEEATA